MIIPLMPSKVHYTTRPAEGGGATIYEDEQPIAFCTSDVYAHAIANALNVYRALLGVGKLLLLSAPKNSRLN